MVHARVLHTCLPRVALLFCDRMRECQFREVGSFVVSLVHGCYEVVLVSRWQTSRLQRAASFGLKTRV
jgi:hypothetical protein